LPFFSGKGERNLVSLGVRGGQVIAGHPDGKDARAGEKEEKGGCGALQSFSEAHVRVCV
jgi:hypothetical protein